LRREFHPAAQKEEGGLPAPRFGFASKLQPSPKWKPRRESYCGFSARVKGQVKYRFVIDISSLKQPAWPA